MDIHPVTLTGGATWSSCSRPLVRGGHQNSPAQGANKRAIVRLERREARLRQQ